MKKYYIDSKMIYVFSDGTITDKDFNPFKQYDTPYNYKVISSYQNGKNKVIAVHRLVALTYISNPENKPQVNHIDGNKQNNHVDNLEWVTASENLKHSYKYLGRISPNKNKHYENNRFSKSVVQISLDGFIIGEYSNAVEASEKTGVCRQDICKVRRGTRKTAGGYYWK